MWAFVAAVGLAYLVLLAWALIQAAFEDTLQAARGQR